MSSIDARLNKLLSDVASGRRKRPGTV